MCMKKPCASQVATVPDEPYRPCPTGTAKVDTADAIEKNISYTHIPKRILRTAADSLILEKNKIMIINVADAMKDNEPVPTGMNTIAFT